MTQPLTEARIGVMLTRIRRLVETYGGDSPRLQSIKDFYGKFKKYPSNDAFDMLSAAVTEVEETTR